LITELPKEKNQTLQANLSKRFQAVSSKMQQGTSNENV
jgi:hypothetical protein